MLTAQHRRLVLACTLAAGLVAAVVTVPTYSFSREGSVQQAYEAQRPQRAADGHFHDHSDPATKNAVSRGGVTAGTADPTSAKEAKANAAYVARHRTHKDPKLVTTRLRSPRRKVPQNRYAVAGGCYRLYETPVRFQATDLGVHLLYRKDRTFLSGGSGTAASWAAEPSVAAEWTTRRAGKRFTFRLADGRYLHRARNGTFRLASTPSKFALRRTSGCTKYPEVDVNVSGRPHAGTTKFQEVRGYVDPHVHGMAFEFLGGEVHCGRPWHKYGAPYALVDCPDHSLTGGKGALLESVLSGEASHDPVGWPTFKDWPAPNSLTHEGTYYKWMERAWRGGQRMMVNLLVENGKLCEIYPLKRNSCNDMESARLQAKRMRELERYVDAQYGGPGKGWYRIVTNPFQARKVINEGKMAIVMGIEVSIPFGCTMKLDIPQCDADSITRQLTDLHELGVRQMELVNKFDNALAGVAGDNGAIGVPVNLANFLETGSFWSMEHCEPADGESADRTQTSVPNLAGEQQDALFAAVAKLSLPITLPSLPIYPRPLHCNTRGLTDLGEHLLGLLADKHMLIDPDHMSVKARRATLDLLEERNYSGVVSSHSWSTPDSYPRIYSLGGFVAPMAGDSTGFFKKWQRHLGWADKRFYFGFGYGADINGLAHQGDPRGADAKNKVRYPFRGLNGVTIRKQHSGQRVYDVNLDGVPHYGMYPDWIEDLRRIGGANDGAAIVEDLTRGAEAFLQTWERAYGIRPDSCRNPDLRMRVTRVKRLVKRGMTTRQVMAAVGQPFQRKGTTYTVCARTTARKKVPMRITFTQRGRVVRVTRS